MLAAIRTVSSKGPALFRYRELDGQVLVTNEVGDWHWLSADDFRRFVEGRVRPEEPLHRELSQKGFLRDGLDTERMAERLRAQRAYVQSGPTRHTIAVTRQSNVPSEFALPKGDTSSDLKVETAERICDTAFMTTSPTLAFALTGGEPLLALPVCRHVFDYAQRKNKLSLKELRFSIRTNLADLTDEAAAFILESGMRVRAAIDAASPLAGEVRDRAFANLARLSPKVAVQGEITLTAEALLQWRQLLEQHVAAGCHSVVLRAPDLFDREAYGEGVVGVHVDAYMDVWKQAVLALVELAQTGALVVEESAAQLLRRVLGRDPVPGTALRSPAAEGIGELAYDVDGLVYTSERGLKAALMGDDAFLLGSITREGYHDLVSHPTVRALVMASILDGQPGWVDSAYKPYAGISPVECYWEQGSIHGRMGDSTQARLCVAKLDFLFRTLRDGDAATRATLEKWADAQA